MLDLVDFHVEITWIVGLIGIGFIAVVPHRLESVEGARGIAYLLRLLDGPIGVLASQLCQSWRRPVTLIHCGDRVVVARLKVVRDMLTEDGESADEAGQIVVTTNL